MKELVKQLQFVFRQVSQRNYLLKTRREFQGALEAVLRFHGIPKPTSEVADDVTLFMFWQQVLACLDLQYLNYF